MSTSWHSLLRIIDGVYTSRNSKSLKTYTSHEYKRC